MKKRKTTKELFDELRRDYELARLRDSYGEKDFYHDAADLLTEARRITDTLAEWEGA